METITNKPVSDTERPDLSPPTDGEIATRIQALPQEMQDAILSFTDAFDIPAKVRLTEHVHEGLWFFRKCYKLPVALQLNRKLREKYAQEYYSTTVFEVVTNDHHDFWYWTNGLDKNYSSTGASSHVALWLQSLSTAHLRMISSLQITASGTEWFDDERDIDDAAEDIQDFLERAGEHGLSLNVVLATLEIGCDGMEHIKRFDSQGEVLPERSGLDVATFSLIGHKNKIPDGAR